MKVDVFSQLTPYMLKEFRKLLAKRLVTDLMVMHYKDGYYILFNVISGCHEERSILITETSKSPRCFKKARTYTRTLKSLGINSWTVIKEF